jgi:hypothetical protein
MIETPIYFPSRAERRLLATPAPELPLRAADTTPRRDGAQGKDSPELSDHGTGQSLAPAAIGDPTSAPAAGAFFDLPGLRPGGSLAAVLAERLRHVANGHTPETDAGRSLKQQATILHRYADEVHAFVFNPRIDRDHAALRVHTVKLAAFALALIDRLDWEAR